MIISDGYTISDVVMYWRDEPVVGVEVRQIMDDRSHSQSLIRDKKGRRMHPPASS